MIGPYRVLQGLDQKFNDISERKRDSERAGRSTRHNNAGDRFVAEKRTVRGKKLVKGEGKKVRTKRAKTPLS